MKEYLDQLDTLLSDESKWTKDAWARDANGDRCQPNSKNAVCWCLVGALTKIAKDRSDTVLHTIFKLTTGRRFGLNAVVRWNDAKKRTFADVKALIAKARAAAEEQP